jgi:hypothetical protein
LIERRQVALADNYLGRQRLLQRLAEETGAVMPGSETGPKRENTRGYRLNLNKPFRTDPALQQKRKTRR